MEESLDDKVDRLCKEYNDIQSSRDRSKTPDTLVSYECGAGWVNIIEPLLIYCRKNNIKVGQIKEKYGTLRFYVDQHDPVLEAAIDIAETLSQKTCETCGEEGEMRDTAWTKVLCDEHYRLTK